MAGVGGDGGVVAAGEGVGLFGGAGVGDAVDFCAAVDEVDAQGEQGGLGSAKCAKSAQFA